MNHPMVPVSMIAPFGIRPKGTLSARMLPLAGALRAYGYLPRIVAPPVHNPEDAGRQAQINGVPVYHTTLPRLPGPAGVIEQSGALLRAALVSRPALIHLFKPKGYGGLAVLLARALRPDLPVVIDTDDWEGSGGWNDLLPYPPAARALFAWQERDLPRRAAAVTVASRTLESLVWSMGVSPARVFLVPNGVATVPPLRTAPPPLPPRVLLYTRFWEFELAPLVAALVALVQARPDVRVLVVGAGERGEEIQLAALARRAGIEAHLDMRGWVEPEALPGLFALAHIALVPMDDTLINRARGLAKFLELMGAGLPLVASAVGMAVEYLDQGACGVLVPPGQPAALARAAAGLLDDAACQAMLAARAHQRVQSCYSWQHLAETVARAYAAAASDA